MQALYTYYKHNGTSSLNQIEKELFYSINKTYDLYNLLLTLPIDICNYAQKRIEIAQNKKLPTETDLNPNTRFIDNLLIHQIRINNQLLLYLETKKLNWSGHPNLIKELYEKIINSNEYKAYMESETTDYQKDKQIIIFIFKNIIANLESLYITLEEQSIYWNDEVEFVISSIIKTIKKFKENEAEEAELLPLFKNEDDIAFTKDLFRKAILKHTEYKELIKKFSKNWDFERIAFMDILLLEMAICEATEFINIPIKVTINEYIELSKFYSTKKSSVFINGILDKVILYLKENNKIQKHGRGLQGEI